MATKDQKKYELTEEHKAQIRPHALKWQKITMSCETMSAEDREKTADAINVMYANVPAAPPKAIVFVRSHLVLAVAGAIAAKAWEQMKKRKIKPGTTQEIDPDLRASILGAVEAVEKLLSQKDDDTYPYRVNFKTFRTETLEAIFAALATTVKGPEGKEDKALVKELSQAIKGYYDIWNGGNLWSGYPACLSFFRDVCAFDLGKLYDEWAPYEKAAIHSGPRMMGEDFVIVCDRPLRFEMDEQKRLNDHDHPAVEFRDGFKLYQWNGVAIPRLIIDNPEKITVEYIKGQTNAEVRRIAREKFGEGRYLLEIKAKLIDWDESAAHVDDPLLGGCSRVLLEDDENQRWLVGSDSSTSRVYYMLAPNDVKTCAQAHEAISRLKEKDMVAQS